MRSLANLVLFVLAVIVVLIPAAISEIVIHDKITAFVKHWGFFGKVALVVIWVTLGVLLLRVVIYFVGKIFFPHLHEKKDKIKST